MAGGAESRGSSAESSPGEESGGGERQFRFLRYSHIFASLVREVLEAKFLREVAPDSLTLSQFHLLKVIALNGDHQVGEVAHFLGVSPPAATKNIDKLVRLGLVMRSPSKGDRRATLLSASPEGRRLVQAYEGLKSNRLAPVFEAFGSTEMDQLAQLLERFSLSLIERENAGRKLCLRCAAYCEDQCAVGQLCGGCPYQEMRGSRLGQGAIEELS